jgi:hypothetical protein
MTISSSERMASIYPTNYNGYQSTFDTHNNNQFSHLIPTFFYDEQFLVTLNSKPGLLSEAKGHIVLLGSNVESFLKAAALIDGSTVDFLFGLKYAHQTSHQISHANGGVGRSRANDVKKFLRTLDIEGQEAAADFYLVVYQALVSYQEENDKCCGFLCSDQKKKAMNESIERGFQHFIKRLRSQQSRQ